PPWRVDAGLVDQADHVRATRPAAERALRDLEGAVRVECAGEHEHRAAGADGAAMVCAHLVDRRRAHDVLVADRPRAERMAGGIRQLAPGLVDDATGVLL